MNGNNSLLSTWRPNTILLKEHFLTLNTWIKFFSIGCFSLPCYYQVIQVAKLSICPFTLQIWEYKKPVCQVSIKTTEPNELNNL